MGYEGEKKEFCCKYYRLGCDFECRQGKYWPDGRDNVGDWGSTDKMEYCCRVQNTGCPGGGVEFYKSGEAEELGLIAKQQGPSMSRLEESVGFSFFSLGSLGFVGAVVALALLFVANRVAVWGPRSLERY